MADLLGRLAARALGQAPSLEPRIPSRYESAPDVPDEPWLADPPDLAVAPPARQAPAVASMVLESSPPPPTPPAASPVPGSQPPIPATPHLRVDQGVVGVQTGQKTETTPRSTGQTAPATPLVPVTPQPVTPQPATPRPVTPQPGTPLVPVPAPPSVLPSVSRGRGTAVHISIGRIEVRAQPAPAVPAVVAVSPPAPPHRTPAPAHPAEPAGLTLAAYLRGER
jgi:hypothetical protein